MSMMHVRIEVGVAEGIACGICRETTSTTSIDYIDSVPMLLLKYDRLPYLVSKETREKTKVRIHTRSIRGAYSNQAITPCAEVGLATRD